MSSFPIAGTKIRSRAVGITNSLRLTILERITSILGDTSFLSRRKYFDTQLREITKKLEVQPPAIYNSNFVEKKNKSKKTPMYWSEAFTDGVIPDLTQAQRESSIVQIWNENELVKTTSAGFPSVKSNGYYLDLQRPELDWWNFYSRDPLEEVRDGDKSWLFGARTLNNKHLLLIRQRHALGS